MHAVIVLRIHSVTRGKSCAVHIAGMHTSRMVTAEHDMIEVLISGGMSTVLVMYDAMRLGNVLGGRCRQSALAHAVHRMGRLKLRVQSPNCPIKS